jgi:hypothetical protein
MTIQSNKVTAALFADKLRHTDDHAFNVNSSLSHSGGFYMNATFVAATAFAGKAFADISALLERDANTIQDIASYLSRKDEEGAINILSKFW